MRLCQETVNHFSFVLSSNLRNLINKQNRKNIYQSQMTDTNCLSILLYIHVYKHLHQVSISVPYLDYFWRYRSQIGKSALQIFRNSCGCLWDIFIRFTYQVTINKQFCYVLRLFLFHLYILLVVSFRAPVSKTLCIRRYIPSKIKRNERPN